MSSSVGPSQVNRIRVRPDDDIASSSSSLHEANDPSSSDPLLVPTSPTSPTYPFSFSSPSSSSRAKRRNLHLRGGTLSVRRAGDSYTYAYAYGPAGLAGLRANAYALRCAVFASLGGLTFGYDQGVIANVLVMSDFVARWPVGAWERGLMSALHSFWFDFFL